MMDDEIGKLMVVNKIVCEYCISVTLQILNILKCIILCIGIVLCYSQDCIYYILVKQ